MTNIERQILINQVAIMSTLVMIICDSKIGTVEDVECLGKCVKMTNNLITDSKCSFEHGV